MTLDRDRMAKLMELAASTTFPNEATSAIGRATMLLRAAGMTWTQFCVAPVQRPVWPEPPVRRSFDACVDEMTGDIMDAMMRQGWGKRR